MSDDYDPDQWIQKWPDNTPLLMMHSQEDQVVPYIKGKRLFGLANEPKQWVENSGPHIATFRGQNMRDALLYFMSK
jgi:hypothetical protein